ncbi:3-phosphoglycerate dehydrogenase [Sulfolobales archaeon HS-7]|nr:3-phosphoglycerate dehydrogenase [Sulfolobales archaeon HS-7]
MEPFNILIADPVDSYIIDKLSALELIRVRYEPNISRGELLQKIANYDVLIVRSRTVVDSEIIRNAKKLKIIARAGIGLDNIDLEEASKRGIKIVYAPGASTNSAAELTLGLIVTAARRIDKSMSYFREGKMEKVTGIELFGKTLGIIGYGRIGSRVAEMARAFGMNILAYDIIDVSNKVAFVNGKQVSLEELLANSDIITLHVTVDIKSRPILGEKEFSIIKEGSIVVNTSRAVVIEPGPLLEALNSNKVSCYAADVFWEGKSDVETKIYAHPNAIFTTHIGAQTKESQRRIAEMLVQNIIKEIGGVR